MSPLVLRWTPRSRWVVGLVVAMGAGTVAAGVASLALWPSPTFGPDLAGGDTDGRHSCEPRGKLSRAVAWRALAWRAMARRAGAITVLPWLE